MKPFEVYNKLKLSLKYVFLSDKKIYVLYALVFSKIDTVAVRDVYRQVNKDILLKLYRKSSKHDNT